MDELRRWSTVNLTLHKATYKFEYWICFQISYKYRDATDLAAYEKRFFHRIFQILEQISNKQCAIRWLYTGPDIDADKYDSGMDAIFLKNDLIKNILMLELSTFASEISVHSTNSCN